MANFKTMNKEQLAEYALDNFELELDPDELSKDEMIEAIEEAEADQEPEDGDEGEAETEEAAPANPEAAPESDELKAAIDGEYAKVFLKTVNGSRREFIFKDRHGRDWSVISGDKGWSASGPETISDRLRKNVVRAIAKNIAQYAIDNPAPAAE